MLNFKQALAGTATTLLLVSSIAGAADGANATSLDCFTDGGTAEFTHTVEKLRGVTNSADSAVVDHYVNVGSNMGAERGKCDQYPGGIPTLTDDLNKAKGIGLSCMRRLGGRPAKDADALDVAFNTKLHSRLQINCAVSPSWDTLAQAGGSLSAGGLTSMTVATGATAGPDSSLRQATIFHEMLHWLGYKHGEGHDMPYLIELCCFKVGDHNAGGDACDLAKDPKVISAWDTGPVQARFARLLIGARISNNVIVTSAFDAAARASAAQGAAASASVLLDTAAAMSDAAEAGSDRAWAALTLAYTGLARLPAQPPGLRLEAQARIDAIEQKHFPSNAVANAKLAHSETQPHNDERRDVARDYAKVLSAIIDGNPKSIVTAAETFKRERTSRPDQPSRGCDSMDGSKVPARGLTSMAPLQTFQNSAWLTAKDIFKNGASPTAKEQTRRTAALDIIYEICP